MPYAKFVEQRIFVPLEMTNTAWATSAAPRRAPPAIRARRDGTSRVRR